MLLQSAAAFISVPLLQEAIGVALKIIEVCEVLVLSRSSRYVRHLDTRRSWFGRLTFTLSPAC